MDSVRLKPNRPQKYTPRAEVILRIRNEVRDRIFRGLWKAGVLLPSRRAMAEEFGVNPITVQRALAPLIAEGILVPDGRGTVVADAPHIVGESESNNSSVVSEHNRLGIPSLLLNTLVFISTVVPGHFSHRQSPGWIHVIDDGVAAAARQHGLHLMTLNPASVQPSEWKHLIRAHPTGVAVRDLFDCQNEILENLYASRQEGIPLSVYGSTPEDLDCDTVISDHENGAYQLTRWLLGRGSRRILMVLPQPAGEGWQAQRRQGYKHALCEAAIEYSQVLELPDLSFLGIREQRFDESVRIFAGYMAPFILADSPVDAVMAASDGEVPAIAAACRILRRVPNVDISIVGYDNYWNDMMSVAGDPTIPLATVDKFNFEIGKELVRLAVARARGELPTEAVCTTIAPNLVIIDSIAA